MTNYRPDMTREKRHDNLHILPFPVPTAISSFIVPNGHETKDRVRGIRFAHRICDEGIKMMRGYPVFEKQRHGKLRQGWKRKEG
ncbi:hypothetical protein GB937_007942 [Aspergillus fischeri]|nr:hypothetical protein GB937_007942 [Aspergillus fischeri]